MYQLSLFSVGVSSEPTKRFSGNYKPFFLKAKKCGKYLKKELYRVFLVKNEVLRTCESCGEFFNPQTDGVERPHGSGKFRNYCHECYYTNYYIKARGFYPMYPYYMTVGYKMEDITVSVMRSIKTGSGCSHCGLSGCESYVYDLHHIDPSQKNRVPSRMISIESLLDEIENLSVLCAVCHRKIHNGEDIKVVPVASESFNIGDYFPPWPVKSGKGARL